MDMKTWDDMTQKKKTQRHCDWTVEEIGSCFDCQVKCKGSCFREDMDEVFDDSGRYYDKDKSLSHFTILCYSEPDARFSLLALNSHYNLLPSMPNIT